MMERHVKERLIGASILVIVIVGIVPEFLSGQKRVPVSPPLAPPAKAANEVRNVTIDLATSKPTAALDSGAASAAEPPPSAAAEPPHTAATPTPDTPAEPPAPSPAPPSLVAHPSPSPPAATLERPAAPPRSSDAASGVPRAWAVQLGVFGSRANADNLVHQLKAQGASAFVVAVGSKATARYKVRVGPLADRNAAERTLAKLKSQGHQGNLVAPDG